MDNNLAVSVISLTTSLDNFSVTENPLLIILQRFLIVVVETSGRKIFWKVSNGDDSRFLRVGLRPAKLLKLHRYRNIEGKMHPNFSCFGTCLEFSKLHFRSAFL